MLDSKLFVDFHLKLCDISNGSYALSVKYFNVKLVHKGIKLFVQINCTNLVVQIEVTSSD